MAKTIKSGTKGVITLAQFMTTPDFLACAEMQRRWLQTLIESGFNYTLANTTAFSHLTPRRALLYGYAVRRQPHVVAALQCYLGTTGLEILQEDRQESVNQVLRMARFQLAHAEPGGMAATKFAAQIERLKLGIKMGRPAIEEDDEPEEDEPEIATPQTAQTVQPTSNRVPAGATALVDAQGIVRGYRTAENEYVQLADVEVNQ